MSKHAALLTLKAWLRDCGPQDVLPLTEFLVAGAEALLRNGLRGSAPRCSAVDLSDGLHWWQYMVLQFGTCNRGGVNEMSTTGTALVKP